MPVASPLLSTVYTDVLELDQFTVEVRFCVLPSEYVPVAVNCCVVPLANGAGFAGVTAIETRVAFVTVARKSPVMPSTVTATVLLPGATPVITPVESTVTNAGFEDV